MKLLPLISLFALVLASCAAPPTASSDDQARKKIHVDLNARNGETLVAYEFCIPQDDAKRAQVKAIDPSLQFYPGTPGRIRCTREQILCIGEGGTQETLMALARLDFIERIDPFYGE